MATLVVVVAACQGTPQQTVVPPAIPQSELPITSSKAISMVNKIAYVGSSGDIFIVDPDGGDRINLTGGTKVGLSSGGGVLSSSFDGDDQYFWPTWSPGGGLLAASHVNAAGAVPEVTVEVFDVANGGVRTIYQNETPSLIAQGAPHYLYWAPGGEYLAFLVSSPAAFALMVADLSDAGGGQLKAPDLVQTGAPLYFHWGQGGDQILLHTRDEVKLTARPFDAGPSTLLAVGQGFRVAALSPDGQAFAYTAANSNGTGASLFIAGIGTPDSGSAILDVGPLSAFAWSPDGSQLAVVEGGGPGGSGFQRLVVIPAAGAPAKTLAEEEVIAFFWSPAGDTIAWVTVDPQDRMLEWKISPVADPAPKLLLRFHPTGDMLTMLSFFDQYAYSHSPWSPDGRWLVAAGTREEPYTRRNGGSPRGERIFVLDATGVAEPRELAEGSLGVWSWN